MVEFNSDDSYVYYCGQESLRKNGVAIIVNKRVQNAVFVCKVKNTRMISIHFQGKKKNLQNKHQQKRNAGTYQKRYPTYKPKEALK